MYSSLKNVQILVSLLKKFDVKNIVISAGTRHTPFVYSVEHDDFFNTYSVVDERSAGFFAIGLIEELHVPVAVVCTSGTAAANYVSAANEAFYQQLPLLLLTADRNHYYMFQQEEQMIPQEGLYKDVCKNVVTLGHVRDEKDFWYYSRICNEALLDLTQGEKGPVHINFIVENDYPIQQGIVKFEEKVLPDIKKINRLTLEDNLAEWKLWSDKLKSSKVLIIYGQFRPLSDEEVNIIEDFCEKYDVVISSDIISNLHTKYSIPTFAMCRVLNSAQMESLCPDIVITMNANSISEIKSRLSQFKNRFDHWHVSAKGKVSDPFKILSDVVACSPITFFEKFANLAESTCDHEFYNKWKNLHDTIGQNGTLNEEKIVYSSMYAVQQYIKNIPSNSLLHIANSNSIRLSAYFDVNSNVAVYDNRGSHGIDGSMSAFIGQASVSGRLSFLLIGDLSFFYDMNALWNRYLGNNIRILVCNNSGGAIFYTYPNTKNVPTLAEHIAAEHTTSVEAWVKCRGFKYLSARTQKEFDENLPQLMNPSFDSPVLMEVFTDKEIDANCIKTILQPYHSETKSIKSTIGSMMPAEMKKIIKKIIQ
ncbi:MAG: 2-succinyl-5-enolpyruvyl-6-hydroxy-3-cyclohexene-1-carboxylic-acid synthase [Clostridia bacterium]|nr:2-succinyl-5-enolpyruvyl-6-hydroxy-3-cyclohexene-1-carboxylic-acid synthase [Clostridia bacterium]